MAQLKMYWLPGTPVSHCELPSGYAFSRFNGTQEDKLAWCECCRNGLIGDEDGADAFDDCIGAHTDCVYFLDYQGEHVGTVTPIYHADTHIGEVHMVSIRTDFRGKGLGKYLNMLALEKLQQENLRYIYLTTDEWRKAAILSYLHAGFVPVEYDRGMPFRWQKVLRDLDIPSAGMVDEEGKNMRTLLPVKKTVRIGVFGAGRGKSLMQYCRTTPGVELTAVCDHYEPLLNEIRESDPDGNIQLFTNFDDFLKTDMDGVVLANYATQHAPYAIRCLEKGLHVISEVLPVQTMQEAVQLVEAVEKSGKIYSYAENYCYMGAPREMRRLYRQGTVGKFEYAEGEYMHNCEPGWHFYTQGNPNHWRNTMYAHYYCTHSFGPIVHITGLKPVRVTGFELPFNARMHRMGAKAGPIGVEMIEMEDGSLVKSLHGVGPSKNSIWYSLYGENGRMESAREDGEAGGVDTLYLTQADDEKVDVLRPEIPEGYGHSGSDFYPMHHFVEAILGDPDAEIIDVYEALDMFLPGLFAYRSVLAGGVPMAIPDLRDPAQREKWRHDTACTDPAIAGDQLIPSYSKGNPSIPDEVYEKLRQRFRSI